MPDLPARSSIQGALSLESSTIVSRTWVGGAGFDPAQGLPSTSTRVGASRPLNVNGNGNSGCSVVAGNQTTTVSDTTLVILASVFALSCRAAAHELPQRQLNSPFDVTWKPVSPDPSFVPRAENFSFPLAAQWTSVYPLTPARGSAVYRGIRWASPVSSDALQMRQNRQPGGPTLDRLRGRGRWAGERSRRVGSTSPRHRRLGLRSRLAPGRRRAQSCGTLEYTTEVLMERRTAFCFGFVRALSTGSTEYGNASNVGHPLLTLTSPLLESLVEL